MNNLWLNTLRINMSQSIEMNRCSFPDVKPDVMLHSISIPITSEILIKLAAKWTANGIFSIIFKREQKKTFTELTWDVCRREHNEGRFKLERPYCTGSALTFGGCAFRRFSENSSLQPKWNFASKLLHDRVNAFFIITLRL